jgi:hypothetical protein
MQKGEENYFLDKKLLSTLHQSTQLQSQLKVFLYKDQDIISSSSKNVGSAQPVPESTAGTKPSRKSKRHAPKGSKLNLDKELQDYLLIILQLFQYNEINAIHQLKNFLGDSVNFFIIENSSRNRQNKLKQIQSAKQSKLKL